MLPRKDFFISYTLADKVWADWIAWELQEANYTCVYQAGSFGPGQNFIQRMEACLSQSRHIIAVLSPAYFNSQFALAELESALTDDPRGLKARLIPVRVEKCELSKLMTSRIYIDLVGKTKDHGRVDLIRGLETARAMVTEPDSIVFNGPPPDPFVLSKKKLETDTPETSGRERRDKKPKTTKILFLGLDIGRGLNLRGQFSEMEAIFSKSPHTNKVELKGIFDATVERLPDILNDEMPTIVHLSGNQNGGRVLIKTDNGGVTTIPASALAVLLQALDGVVKLAIVDTCESYGCAKATSDTVEFAMGVRGKPYDDHAILFYSAFYKALVSGRSIKAALQQATARARFQNIPISEIPVLCVRRGADPERMKFV